MRQSIKLIRVFVVDDHAVVRTGLKQLVADTADMEIVGDAASGTEAVEKLHRIQSDVLLLDISMPERSGIDVLGQIRRDNPGLKILIFSMYPEDQYGVSLLRAGAHGYVSKNSDEEDVLEAIRQVACGRTYISTALAEILAEEVKGLREGPLHRMLSERELQIFRKIVAGNSVGEIAKTLCLSPKTVSTYRSRVLEKMRMKSNADLTAYAIRNELIE